MNPLITVIIPVYNVEDYLPICIDSVLSQTYSNIEILLVDDGSTDSSGEICDTYGKKHQIITVYHKENGGLSDARNYGISKSKGEYISFIDSDDWLEPKMYEVLYELINHYDADVAITNYNVHDGNKIYPNRNICKGTRCLTSTGSLEEVLTCGDFGYMISTKLYRRKVLSNIKFIKDLIFEDIVHTSQVLLKACRVVYTSNVYFNYRIRANSLSHGKRENLYDAIKARNIRFDIVKNERPELLPFLREEYKSAFFFIIRELVKDKSLSERNKIVVSNFKKWLKTNDMHINWGELFRLWLYVNLPILNLRIITT